MRLLIGSDIHGRLGPMKKFSSLILSYRPDRVLLLGDYLYAGPRNALSPDYDPSEVSKILNKWASIIVAVKGDCDSRADQSVLRFNMLEDCRVLDLAGRKADLIHGDLLTSDIVDVERGDILMFGHTHVPVLKKEDGVIYLNPGSISYPKSGSPASFALFEANRVELKRLDDQATFAYLDLN